MAEFAYIARNASGEDVVGSLSAATKREALCALTEKSLFPLRVESAKPSLFKWKPKKRITGELLASNLGQLADLLQSGVPLLSAMEVLVGQCMNPSLSEVLTDIRDQVVDGASLDEAFARHPDVFGDLTVSMVRAGCEGAFLEDALKRTADFLELQEELKGRVVGAMAYPAFLAIFGFGVTVVLIVFFVPKFAELFEQLEQNGGLPEATVALLWISDTLGQYGLWMVPCVVGSFVWLKRAAKNERGKMMLDRWKLKIPVVGKIFLGSAVSRFCRVLGTLLRNGVPLLRALEISRDSAGNALLAAVIRDSAENISSGETLSKPLGDCGLIPLPVMAMIRVAEESNNLENVLINIADGIDRKTDRQLDIMVRLVEPAMLMVMGTVIMFVLVALLLPVFDMSAAMN